MTWDRQRSVVFLSNEEVSKYLDKDIPETTRQEARRTRQSRQEINVEVEGKGGRRRRRERIFDSVGRDSQSESEFTADEVIHTHTQRHSHKLGRSRRQESKSLMQIYYIVTLDHCEKTPKVRIEPADHLFNLTPFSNILYSICISAAESNFKTTPRYSHTIQVYTPSLSVR